MGVLRDNGDGECISILNKCRGAVPRDMRKVIIVRAAVMAHEVEEQCWFDVRNRIDVLHGPCLPTLPPCEESLLGCLVYQLYSTII